MKCAIRIVSRNVSLSAGPPLLRMAVRERNRGAEPSDFESAALNLEIGRLRSSGEANLLPPA
jgi:hypothetical protein